MSQKVTKNGTLQEKEEKSETPAKEMKKKMAANAEKEKQAAEKITDKPTGKPSEKPTEKSTAKPAAKPIDKPTEKSTAKQTDKATENSTAKPADKSTDKNAEIDKKTDKQADKKSATQEKAKDDSHKGETSGKEKQEKKEQPRAKQNGKPHNGVTDVTLSSNGDCDSVLNGSTVSDTDDDEAVLVIEENDELFPELTYDDASDVECFESPTPECVPSRSLTRRSQAKVTRTPETPRPASDKQTDKEPTEESKDSKLPKHKEDATTNMKLRSSDSPKPSEAKKGQEPKKVSDSPKKSQEDKESPKKAQDEVKESPKKNQDGKNDKKQDNAERSQELPDKSQEEKENEKSTLEIDVDVVVENESGQESRKTDTNYSKSRVKVSPYRRSLRIADQTNSSLIANYTGNNTTMEMDITESSIADECLDDSSYLSGLRSICGRRSYKPLKEMALRHVDRSLRSVRSERSEASITSDNVSRPTGTVVGRKRKPDAGELDFADESSGAGELFGKRVRLLDRLAMPFRRTVTSTPIPRRTPEIVGINSDLPLTAPVASENFDPEALKPEVAAPVAPATSLAPTDKDNKRCTIM